MMKGTRLRASSAVIEEPRLSTGDTLVSLQQSPRAAEHLKDMSTSAMMLPVSFIQAKRHLMQIIDSPSLSRSCGRRPNREGAMASPNLTAPLPRSARASEKAKIGISRWPIRAASMRALSELGLSDIKIAGYLKVRPEEVTSLRNLYRIGEGQWKA
jgi:hypothetical protein